MTWRRVLRRLRGEEGFSLIEMITTMAIMGIVMTSLTTVFISASNSELDMNNRFQAQLNARLALDKFRREVHCASSVTLNSTSSVTIVLPSGCKSSGTITWCAQGSGTRWGLYRVSGATCTGGVKFIDYLIQSNLFNYTAPSVGSQILPKVNVDFPVNVKPSKTFEKYELKDDVVLRNGTRA
jgi:prepilin-type N-terminal cleavage/methylation domain-containing protein